MASDDSAQPQKPIAEMLKSFESDNPSKTDDGVVQTSHPTQNGTLLDGTPSIPSMDAVNSIKETESDYHEASVADQSMYYPVNNCYGYYYPGSEMQYGDWNEQGYMAVTNGTDMQQATIQSNDTPLAYYMPGFQPGYDPYTSLIPGAVLGVDGMYLGQQPYVTSQVTPQSDGSFVSYQPLVGYGQEMISAYGYEAPLWNFNNANGHARNFTLPSATSRPKYPVKKVHPSKPASKLRGGSVEAKGSHLVLELSPRVEVPNSSIKSSNKTFASSKRYPSPAKSLLHTYQGKSDILSPNISNGTNNKENGRSSVATEKPAPRNKSVNGFGNTELLNDKNSGPRTNHSKNISTSTSYHSSVAGSELDDNCGSTSKTVVIKRDDYNLLDFPIKYEHALFFIIKSYSEDDIHKSIKYNVWTSTTNGNKKLDDAFQKAQEKIAERGPSSSKCPVFLFFSVNASGQFCGVAEMIGGVDFNKDWNFWQQDKWNGSFPVKWHIIKDVPNSHFRHIILANNDNKPVTNSRDTQEVMFQQGSDMLSIFKGYSNKTCILDDFGFYENRQRVMQEKRNKLSSSPAAATPENFQPKSKQTTDPIISSMENLTLSTTKIVTPNKPQISESGVNS